MATLTTEKSEGPAGLGRVADAVRQAAHLSHEARLLKSVARDAIEEGVHAARLRVRRGVRQYEDFKEGAVRQVRRRPLQIVAASFGAGLLLGAAAGLTFSARRRSC